nr:helix-turn-helix domain-containing protein [Rhodococcus jostii]
MRCPSCQGRVARGRAGAHRPLAGHGHRDRAPAAGPLPRLRRHPYPVAHCPAGPSRRTTEVIGNALAHKVKGIGLRRIAERMDRPESTVRRWLRRATDEHLQWMCHQGNRRLIQIASEVFSAIRYARNLLLQHTLCILSAAAVEDRRGFGFTDPPWDLIGIYTQGRLLSPPRSG